MEGAVQLGAQRRQVLRPAAPLVRVGCELDLDDDGGHQLLLDQQHHEIGAERGTGRDRGR
ncbi:MAG: hypothetical protein HY744_34055 [Deltaproteobacteria bacterium]|nr:hypothetical protein [Deltaproteobacteria bacterium]